MYEYMSGTGKRKRGLFMPGGSHLGDDLLLCLCCTPKTVTEHAYRPYTEPSPSPQKVTFSAWKSSDIRQFRGYHFLLGWRDPATTSKKLWPQPFNSSHEFKPFSPSLFHCPTCPLPTNSEALGPFRCLNLFLKFTLSSAMLVIVPKLRRIAGQPFSVSPYRWGWNCQVNK